MSDYDNGFKRAQQMYDAQEPPDEPDEPDDSHICPKCGSEGEFLRKVNPNTGESYQICSICGHIPGHEGKVEGEKK